MAPLTLKRLLLLSTLALAGCTQSMPGLTPSPLPTAAVSQATVQPGAPPTAAAPIDPGCAPIAFTIHEPEPAQNRIALICADGSGFHIVSPDGLSSGGPSWSPDGEHIAFIGQRTGEGAHVFTLNVDGSGLKQLTPGAHYTRVIWEPDGASLSIQSTDEAGLYAWRTYDLSTGRLSEPTEPGYDFFFQTRSVSPDGSRVAYMSLTEQAGRNDGSSQIHVQNRDGSADRALTADIWANVSPQWSPDGQRIAYLSEQGAYNVFNLFSMNADGTEARRLTDSMFSESTVFSWSPDGAEIVIAQQQDLSPQLMIVDTASGDTRLLYAGGDAPAWSPRRPSPPAGDGPSVAPSPAPTQAGATQPIVEAFLATNTLSVEGLTYIGAGQVTLDARGAFPVDNYTDAVGNSYLVDPASQSLVAFEANPALTPATPTAQLSADALDALAQAYMLRNTPHYSAMREGFALPDQQASATDYVVTWVYGTTCRRDGSFPYIEVALALDGRVLAYRNTLARGDLVGAYGDVNEWTVNVRAGPGLAYPVLVVAAKGRTILLGRYEDPVTGERWWQIPINCIEPTRGWVADAYVTIDPAFVEAVPEKQLPAGGVPTPMPPVGPVAPLEPAPAGAAAYAEIKALDAAFAAGLGDEGGWIHIESVHLSDPPVDHGALPDGRSIPAAYRMIDWYLRDETGLVVKALSTMVTATGEVLQQAVFNGQTTTNVTLNQVFSTAPYRLDFSRGIVSDLSNSAVTVVRREPAPGQVLFEITVPAYGVDVGLPSTSQRRTRSLFDLATGALLYTETLSLGSEGDLQLVERVEVAVSERVGTPPAEVTLALGE